MGLMAELHVRNLPSDLHTLLRDQAAAERRSMSAHVISVLHQALQPADDQSERQLAAIERLREIRQRSRLPQGAAPSEQLVREDRDAAG